MLALQHQQHGMRKELLLLVVVVQAVRAFLHSFACWCAQLAFCEAAGGLVPVVQVGQQVAPMGLVDAVVFKQLAPAWPCDALDSNLHSLPSLS